MALLRISRQCCAAGICAIALVLSTGSELRAQPAPLPEYKLKAVFLFRFAQFVAWPDTAFAEPKSPFVIGILGDDPFGSYLEEAIRGEMIGEHALTIRRFRRAEDIASCQILFISASEADRLPAVLGRVKGRDLLTVGDFDAFAREGGMVRFVTENNRIHLRINIEAAKAAHLTISSKLLSLASIVSPENK
jgi:hypothetical protein